MRAVRAVGTVVAAVALGGCVGWVDPAFGPDRNAHNPFEKAITPQNAASLAVAWSAQLHEGPVGDPVESNAGVTVNGPGIFYGVNATTGSRLWSHEAPNGGTAAPVYGDGDTVLAPSAAYVQAPNEVGHYENVTERLDADTGEVRDTDTEYQIAGRRGVYRAIFGQFQTPRVTVDIGYLGVAHGDTTWTAWYHSANPPAVIPVPRVTLGTQWLYDAGFGIVDTTGNYDVPPGNAVRGYSLTTPNSPDNLYLWPDWFVELDGTTAVPPVLAPHDEFVFTGTDAGTVYAIDVASKQIAWTGDVGTAVTGGLAYANGVLFVPTAAGALFAFDADGCGAATCEARWAISTGSPMTVRPAVAGGVVFTGSQNGVVAAANASGCGRNLCSVLWSDDTGSRITGGPSVLRGRVVVGTEDGRLIAYRPS